MQGFTVVDLVILVVYLAAVLFAGLHFAKKEMKGKEYFKGDGTVPWWVTSVSIFATLLSPISFLSLAGNSYAGTWIMWFAQLGMLLAIPITIKFFLPIYSKLDIDTAYHYLELRFGSKGLRVLGAVMFIIYQIGRMSIIMYLPCMVLGSLTGISVNLLIIIMGIIAIIYSYTGGLKSVLWTDFIQGSVLLIGVTFALIFLLVHLDGGFGAIMHALTTEHKFLAVDQPIFNPNIFKDSVFIMIVGAGFNTMGSYVSSQDIVQRFTTTTLTAMRPDFPALRYRKSPFAPCECTAHPAGFLHRPPALWPHKCSQTRHGHTTGNRLRSNPYCCRKPPVLEQESVPHSRSDCCPPRSHPIPGGGLADGF